LDKTFFLCYPPTYSYNEPFIDNLLCPGMRPDTGHTKMNKTSAL
jgi:hypothetical protein